MNDINNTRNQDIEDCGDDTPFHVRDQNHEMVDLLDDDFNDTFSLNQWLLFHMVTSCEPIQYIVYKNAQPIAFVYSRSHSSCTVWNTVIFDSSDFIVDPNTENMIEHISRRLQQSIPQEEREKIEELLKYYDTLRQEKSKTSKYLEAAEFIATCKGTSWTDTYAQLINWYMLKTWADTIWALDGFDSLLSEMPKEEIRAIETRLQKNTQQ